MSEDRYKKMAPILDRIPEHWGKWLPEPGWDELLLELDRDLAKLDPDYEINQAKEKFGLLRFYVTFSDALMELPETRGAADALIRDAEDRSATICELCGADGSLRPGGWIKTLCNEHAASRDW